MWKLPVDRFKSAYNAFMGRDPTEKQKWGWQFSGSYNRPDRPRMKIQNERSIINTVFTRISVDASTIDMKHVRVNSSGNYESTIEGPLNDILTYEANVDQTGRNFIRDAVFSMLDEGCVALFPSFMSSDPYRTGSVNVLEARVGKIVQWYPDSVLVDAYDETVGKHSKIKIAKSLVPIIENPFYSVMNEPNSTLQRLIRVLNQLDRINDEKTSGKIDLIVQLPYDIKNKARINLAEEKRKNIEEQLSSGGKYGIAYIDNSDKVIQLNRSLENNLWEQAKDLKEDLFSQLGISVSVLDGTADEKVMVDYYSRIVEPIMSSISEEIERKWISRTARAQGQAIRYFRDPFKLIPVGEVAKIADSFTRNEIMTSNEIRAKVGLIPSKDPRADQLLNANLNHREKEVNSRPSLDDKNSQEVSDETGLKLTF